MGGGAAPRLQEVPVALLAACYAAGACTDTLSPSRPFLRPPGTCVARRYIAERASRGLRSLGVAQSLDGGASWQLVGLIRCGARDGQRPRGFWE